MELSLSQNKCQGTCLFNEVQSVIMKLVAELVEEVISWFVNTLAMIVFTLGSRNTNKKIYFEADLVRTKYCICCHPFPNHKLESLISSLNVHCLVLCCTLSLSTHSVLSILLTAQHASFVKSNRALHSWKLSWRVESKGTINKVNHNHKILESNIFGAEKHEVKENRKHESGVGWGKLWF